MNAAVDCVWQSYQRCVENYAFLHEFYLRFLGASPQIAQKFIHTDMDHQVLMLRASLDLMLQGDNPREGLPGLAEVAKLHSRAGVDIPPVLYDHWLESLLQTVEIYDKCFDKELEKAWREVLGSGIAFMKAAY